MPKHLILVAGNIGSGKTSLTERIGQRLGWHTAYESVADNPYLPNFYKDMKAWSFHLAGLLSWPPRPPASADGSGPAFNDH